VCKSMCVCIECVWVFACIYVYVEYMIMYIYVRMLDCMYVCVQYMCCVYGICVRVSISDWLRVAALWAFLVRSRPVTEDSDPVRIGVHC